MTVDPILLEIVKGSLASIEREVETAIGRTARSPMIRDAHDFRAGIHDRRALRVADGPDVVIRECAERDDFELAHELFSTSATPRLASSSARSLP